MGSGSKEDAGSACLAHLGLAPLPNSAFVFTYGEIDNIKSNKISILLIKMSRDGMTNVFVAPSLSSSFLEPSSSSSAFSLDPSSYSLLASYSRSPFLKGI